MAPTYQCDRCQQEPAALVVGRTDTGEQEFIGAACLVPWCLGMLQSMVGDDGLAALATALLALVAPQPPEVAPSTRGRRGGRQKAPETATKPPAPTPAPEAEAPTPNG